MSNHLPYEGAGFILGYQGNIILGVRLKKPEDLAKDPTIEVEYMGGKPEPEDDNNPLQTAHAELIEEVGGIILKDDWLSRIYTIHIFQPFSKKWIWCNLYNLDTTEYSRLERYAGELDSDKWNKSFKSLTGREGSVRRSLRSIVSTPLHSLTDYISEFSEVASSGNRMKDAKTFRYIHDIPVTDILTGKTNHFPLRAFNTVLFESHVDKIVEFFS